MRSARIILPLISGVVSLACFAQNQSKPTAADPYRNEALVIERTETTYKMNADGTGERDLHVVIRIQSVGAAQQFGVLGFPYASAYETPTIKQMCVHKADGTTVDTPASDAMDMPADVTREAPLYSDLKELHIPVRSLGIGDTLEYEIDTKINKAEAPGEFWGTDHFTPPGTAIVLAEVLNLDVPADKYVQVWSPNHKPEVTEQNGIRTYSWKSAQLVVAPKSNGDDSNKPATPPDPDENADGLKVPSVAWTTFRNWAEVGDWYRGLALKQANPNDMLLARANELTANAKTPEDQVRAIYDYVSTHTRYVGIDFGIGRYQPHSAAEVMANQYGDCKDKDTLLEALLHAKGFSTAPALVGVGIAPVPDVPTPAVFNHVITTVNLPAGRIWLDSTPLAAPFQFLSAEIRDQKALIVPAEKPATLEPTPGNAPYSFSARFDATGTLDKDGKMAAKMVVTYRDDDEAVVRALARSVAPAEWDKISQYLSAQSGFGGTTSETQFQNQQDSTVPIVLTYDYQRHPFGDWDNQRIVPLFPAVEFRPLENDASAPEHDIQLGAPRTLTAVSHIKLPDGYRTDLPDPVHVKTDFATFDKTYRFEAGEIVTERTIVVLKNKVPKADWKKYQSFTKDISLGEESWIQLIEPAKTTASAQAKPMTPTTISKSTDGTSTVHLQSEPAASGTSGTKGASAAQESNSQADGDNPMELMAAAAEKFRERDWSGARELLDKIKAKNPNQENLWAMYGAIAQFSDHDNETAMADYRKEIAAHPDNQLAVAALAEAENRAGDSAAARKTLQSYVANHPENTRMELYLASLQNTAEDYGGALKTLQAASDQSPDDRSIRLQIGNTLLRLNRNDEAAAAAKSALDGADDAGTLNDAAYLLAEAGTDLTAAEDASRKSIAKLEEQSASMTTDQANSTAFAQANLLLAAWDTLGYVLFRENKLDAAQPFYVAAWRGSQRAECGEHVGKLEEALGHKNEAETTYVLAEAALGRNDTPDVRGEIKESIQRLKAAGAKPGPANPTQALQDLRTYRIKRPSGASGWGTFRLEITTAGVVESQQMSGEHNITAIKPAIDAMKFPELIPPDSKAHLLRSAVVSCSMGTTCDVVLVPDGGLQTEQ